MKVLACLIAIFLFTSCDTSREVMMTYRNYSLSAERLMPLQYSEDIRSIRIWLSKSTSIDRVITVSMRTDSTFTGELVEYGYWFSDNGKKYGHYKTKAIEPTSGYAHFFQRTDSLNLPSFIDQKNLEVVFDYPVEFCIVEYLNNRQYTRFGYQPGLINSVYKNVDELIQAEFGLSNAPK